MSELATPWIDAVFPLRGRSLPLDHGYALFAAICRVLPRLHRRPAWGVHPVYGRREQRGRLGLVPGSALKLRLPARDVAEILPLAGASLDVLGHVAIPGPPHLHALAPTARLRSRLVTIKGFGGPPTDFRDAVRRQLARVEGLALDPERIEVTVGRRRVLRVGPHTVVGFAVTLDGLEGDASLALQRSGLGGRRHMGAGVLVPPPQPAAAREELR